MALSEKSIEAINFGIEALQVQKKTILVTMADSQTKLDGLTQYEKELQAALTDTQSGIVTAEKEIASIQAQVDEIDLNIQAMSKDLEDGGSKNVRVWFRRLLKTHF